MSEHNTSLNELLLAFGQENFVVGDFYGNAEKILCTMKKVHDEFLSQSSTEPRKQAALLVFSELALSAYPPEDLLLRPSLKQRVDEQVQRICAQSQQLDVYTVFGFPEHVEGQLYNSALVLYKGQKIASYRKQQLPNYQVFDEKRYFQAGTEPCVFSVQGLSIALSICEDLWFDEPGMQAKQQGAEALVNINASPFHLGKLKQRRDILSKRAQQLEMPIIYGHCVGGQDELIFDGGSMIYNPQGHCVFQAPQFQEGLFYFRGAFGSSDDKAFEAAPQKDLPDLEQLRQALVLSVHDYVNKNGFKQVLLGLSGGIDSALTLALATQALGAGRVEAVMMPYKYTAQMSLEDAAKQAKTLGVSYQSLAIEPMVEAFMSGLASEFAGTEPGIAEQNLQARVRGVLLMALSNKKGALVLTTGNKSEIAVGYSTIYGDMAGGFDVLKDLPKTQVYALAQYLNDTAECEVIPQRVIDRPPSAELAPDQKDEDSLPPYDILDQILKDYVEDDLSAEAIIAKGFEREVVYHVLRLVDINEHKRRQAPLGPRLSERAFGKDRRYPISQAWKAGE